MKAEYESDYICSCPSVVNSVISVLEVYSHISDTAALIASLMLIRLLASFLYGVAPNEPVILIAITALLPLTACIAALIPALKAARIDAVVALRFE
jgi:hypothetical protein